MRHKTIIFLISILAITCLFGCENEKKDTVETVFFTQDSLYKITFDKPLELDTFYSWEDMDDNSASHEYKYRFSEKSYPSQQETGFLWTSFADSTYRFTIMHNRNFYWKTLRDFNNDSSILQLKNRLEYRTLIGEITIDSLEVKKIVINNQAYAISKYKQNENYKNGYWTYYLVAYTVVDSNFISFTADCRSKNCDGFFDRFEKTIKSIKIERFK